MTRRRRPWVAAAAFGLVALAAVTAPPALAAAPPTTAPPTAGSSMGAGTPSTAPGDDATQGGTQLADRGVAVNYPGGKATKADKLPWVPASAFLVADATTGQVLVAKDAHGWFRPASTLKVLTAISLIPVLNPDATTVASKQAADTEPNDAGLVAGRGYAIHNLFTALLTISANDAAVALAQATGSLTQGMAIINAEAHHLQAYDTVAVQPNGLDAPGQRTSAYDEALIARQALASSAFLGYDRTLSARFEDKPKHWVTLVNQDQMLTTYPGDVGGKIGWTNAAGATYVGMARRGGQTLIVTLLHCTPLMEFDYAAKLLNWGFAMNGKAAPVGTLVRPLPAVASQQARKKPAPKAVAKRPLPTNGQAAFTGVVSGHPATIGVGFLVLAALIVAAFIVQRRRVVVATRMRARRAAAGPPPGPRPRPGPRRGSAPPGG
jgi:serine-type D-Ala-D-Ala carboxypeptidase (penicillin-binding protein 5/6)